MPEIAEVERARLRIHRQCINFKITRVTAVPDTIVFKDVQSDKFEQTILNKTLIDTKRWGKYFILLLGNEGPHIVAHFGMTGDIRFEHEELAKGLEWPPRFYKLLVTFTDPVTQKDIHMGFKDPRRLSRLRLVSGDPFKAEPISKLGFDPVLGLPEFDYFKKRVLCRAVPVKALLLDQSFSAGVGNWIADEILYQAMIHPAQYTNTMTDEEVRLLYDKMKYVCETAVEAEADEEKFPEDWLMKHRWNKGKSNENKGRLPNGLLLQFETVGGRTSAFAPHRQKLNMREGQPDIKQVIKRKKISVKVEQEDKFSKEPSKAKVIKKKRVLKTEEEEIMPSIKGRERVTSSRYSFRS